MPFVTVSPIGRAADTGSRRCQLKSYVIIYRLYILHTARTQDPPRALSRRRAFLLPHSPCARLFLPFLPLFSPFPPSRARRFTRGREPQNSSIFCLCLRLSFDSDVYTKYVSLWGEHARIKLLLHYLCNYGEPIALFQHFAKSGLYIPETEKHFSLEKIIFLLLL